MKWLFFLAFVVLIGNAFSFAPEKKLDNPVDEKRAQKIFQSLRCTVCEGQSLAESDASLAYGIRGAIRDKVREGVSDKQIMAYLTERYGIEILQNPPLQKSTLVLWLMPIVLLLLGLGFALKAQKTS